MKKNLCLMLFILSFAGSAFAATTVQTTQGAMSIKGGADTAAATAAATPIIKFSTGVFGRINFTADATAKTSTGYLIATRHSTGSKNFATANNITNIYWKQASIIASGSTAATAMATDVGSLDQDGTTFNAGNGWTSY